MSPHPSKLALLNLIVALVLTVLWSTEVKSDNICDTCMCQDMSPSTPLYLIDCSQKKLENQFAQEDWDETLMKQNISASTKLDVRFDFNEMDRVFRFPPLNITSLSFRNNAITFVEDSAFADLDCLSFLDMSYNSLTSKSLPEISFFGKFNGSQHYFPLTIEHLSLSNNNIHSIERNLFDHLPFLTTLDLSSNPLKVLEGSTSQALSQLRNLLVLDLANTSIKSVPAGLFHDLQFLETLDLANNLFTEVPYELSNCHNLTNLDMSGNKLHTLDRTSFNGLETLVELRLNSMPTLRNIEIGSFSILRKMRVIHLAYNRKLTHISDGAFMKITEDAPHWPIEEMYLNDNGLSTLHKGLAAWEYIDILNIQNNPFRCDCGIQWLAEVLVPQIESATSELVADITCRDPEKLKGRALLTFAYEHEEFLNCKPDSPTQDLYGDRAYVPYYSYQAAGIVILTIGVILIVIGVSILGVIVVKRRAIAHALLDHQQIRYERADTDEEDCHHEVHRNYKPNKF